jgi:uracil-DNA glycosylase
MDALRRLSRVHNQIKACQDCAQVCGTPVHGPAIESKIFLVGQAPGAHEAAKGRPFAYTAGRTLFGWFQESAGISEEQFRDHIYIASVARCFPGKSSTGKGDREPSALEIQSCRKHLKEEVAILKPDLIIAVGKVAIMEVLGPKLFVKGNSLADVVGKKMRVPFHGRNVDICCLPHPSGISIWPRVEPGKTLLKQALKQIEQHRSWVEVFGSHQ